jgi:hypothetical protein
MRATLKLGLMGPDVIELFRRAQEALLPGAGPPSSISHNGRKKKVTPDWLERLSTETRGYLRGVWEGRGWMQIDGGEIVKTSLVDYDIDPQRLLALLAELPFDVCSAAPIYDEWLGGLREEYAARRFGRLHWEHGWGCLFRGGGHERLVSRRWLEYGPWRLLRGANDTSLVQFHDLEADAATALAQASPGHERMGHSDTGGYIQADFSYSQDLKGLYYAGERRMIVAVPYGERVSEREMLDACAARLYQALGADKPLDNVVYSFVDDDAARAHLHELWLRGLECRSFVEGVEGRLDDVYQPPPPDRPDWVVRLEGGEEPPTP